MLKICSNLITFEVENRNYSKSEVISILNDDYPHYNLAGQSSFKTRGSLSESVFGPFLAVFELIINIAAISSYTPDDDCRPYLHIMGFQNSDFDKKYSGRELSVILNKIYKYDFFNMFGMKANQMDAIDKFINHEYEEQEVCRESFGETCCAVLLGSVENCEI